jgi:hypothetical protein
LIVHGGAALLTDVDVMSAAPDAPDPPEERGACAGGFVLGCCRMSRLVTGVLATSAAGMVALSGATSIGAGAGGAAGDAATDEAMLGGAATTTG